MLKTLKPPMAAPVALLAVLLAATSAYAADFRAAEKAAGGRFDIFIADASIVDGSGRPAFRGDVLVKGDKVVFVGDAPDAKVKAARTVQAGGRVLAPGFIDTHTHGNALKDDFGAFLAMGVTTVVLGQDGRSANADWDGQETAKPGLMADWMREVETRGLQVNVVPLSGHGTLRRQAGIPDSARALDPAQQGRLNAAFASDLKAGSFGLSTGLEYVPGRYAETGELVPLAKLVAEADGIIISHMRTEDDGLIEGALEELVSYGDKARIQASHLKIVFGKDVAAADRLLALIARKQAEGVRLSADVYPYTAGYGGLGLIFPEWALPPVDYAKLVAERGAELREYVRARMLKRGGPEALLFGSESYVGKTLADVAREKGKPFEEVLLELGPDGAHGAHFIMDEKVQDRLVVSPLTAISTDGGPGIKHPRGTGTYAKLIQHYVEGQKSLTLEEAVRKASGLPASSLGLTDRGLVREGARADLILFDPKKVKAASDYLNPFQPAEGFDLVLVNGGVARDAGATTAGRYGRLLKKSR
ncbi:amidohydrolase family protein [Sandaracinobacter sp. RS1-74]|uniref:N-acyl-D-amino-acid deacylase family protein n=1 Tax=Sandaracinobacteroides sayramensis TaxID=2913411 RepID=UPI001EDC790B|nr:amidohydrolase family protein [Sandaracinobacteroides sayramensis]MCG2840257.1 amidohydrolase family protein [Sandaracinobacteroides sayramensis]